MDTKSERILETCDWRLVSLFTEVDKHLLFSIGTNGGHRTSHMQFKLWMQGRSLQDGEWIAIGDTVTNCDGVAKISKHQYYPSKAVDVWIKPLDWDDISKWKAFVLQVYEIAEKLGIKVKNLGQSIGDWPHWEVVDG